MIESEIRGKMRAAADSEDFLTSTVFGLLKYTPMRPLLAAFLSKATPLKDDERFRKTDFSALLNNDDFDIKFWARHGDFGEPDLLLIGQDFVIAIEVKFNAGMSGDDQLRKYRRLLEVQYSSRSHRHIIYLTKDLTPPILEETVTRDIEKNLWWLSWYELSGVIADAGPHQGVMQEIKSDLNRLLEHRGLSLYQGISFSCPPIIKPLFWEDAMPLITQHAPPPVKRAMFWEDTRL